MLIDEECRVYNVLESLGIPYERHEHPPVYTVDEADAHWAGISATHCKNLFFRNKKGNAHYLVIAEHRKRVDIKALASQLGEDRLSFASPERLAEYLSLEAGAVSPFGLIHDDRQAVRLVVDADLKRSETIAFHPNINTATIALSFADFERFVASTGHSIRYVPV
jgi:Ala-tRNA(Pro) deacylase